MLRHLLASEQLYTLFQPIVGLDRGGTMGFEALTRATIPGPPLSPRELFAEAGRVRLTADLDRLCWKTALTSAAAQIDNRTASARLFLNVQPESLSDAGFLSGMRRILAEGRLDAAQIVVEVTEDTEINDYAAFREGVAFRSEE